MRHTEIVVPADAEVEIVREDCPCAQGTVCTVDDPFAAGCPRRGPFLLLRGGALPLYVRKLEPDVGVVHWAAERPRAHRFSDRGQAEMVREQIVGHRHCTFAVALVPA